jgi:hypothetical protein
MSISGSPAKSAARLELANLQTLYFNSALSLDSTVVGKGREIGRSVVAVLEEAEEEESAVFPYISRAHSGRFSKW